MSKKKKKNDYLPFMDLEFQHCFEDVGHTMFNEEEMSMVLKSLFNKVVLAKKYDVNFTYSINEKFNQNKGNKFNEVSERFEVSIVDMLSDMMDFCDEIHMEVIKK